MFKRIFALAEKLEKLGMKILENGEDLKNKEKFTPELKPRFDTQGKVLENLGDKLVSIGRNFNVVGEKMESIGNRLKDGKTSQLKDYAKQIKELGEKVNKKGEVVKETGVKIQKLEPNVRDPETDKDLEDSQNALNNISQDLEGILKVKTFN